MYCVLVLLNLVDRRGRLRDGLGGFQKLKLYTTGEQHKCIPKYSLFNREGPKARGGAL